jgi:hypothetical protein
VEVLPDEPGLRGAHFAAVVVGPSTKPRGYTVEYDALLESEDSDRKLREAVPARNLRPRPPPPRAPTTGEAPAVHAAVDALLDDAWWFGVALGRADGTGKVKVGFPETREVMEFDASDVRPHLEWADGEWCSPDSMVLKVSIFLKKKEFPSSDESVKNHVLSVILCGSIVSVRNGDPWISLKTWTLEVGTDRDACLEKFRS